MAIDIHVKFDGVEGESTSKDHKGEIEVLSWSWGLSNPPRRSGGGSGAGKPTAHEFTFTHLYDKASPVLAKLAASGRHVKLAWLSLRKAGQGQKDFLKVTMSDVHVSSVFHEGSGEGIVESVTAVPGRIVFEYRQVDAKGSLGPPVSFDWDIVKNKVK
jgi:type VI secretion system secreted protein Hcp